MEKKKELRNSKDYPEDFPWTGGPWSWLADMRDGYPKITYIKDLSEIKYPVNKIQTIEDEEVTTQLALDIQKGALIFTENTQRFFLSIVKIQDLQILMILMKWLLISLFSP